MAALTRWVLAHKRIVVIFWVVVTLIGVASAGSATKALKQKFSVPGKDLHPRLPPTRPQPAVLR
jgi:hypothetical protein